jgi:hypothetical protein
METVCFSETLASTDESTRRQNPEEHSHRRENLKCPPTCLHMLKCSKEQTLLWSFYIIIIIIIIMWIIL